METTEYISKNLNETDAMVIQGMEELCDEVLCKESIDDFLQERDIGKRQGELLKEMILPYLDFLRETCTRYTFDQIVERIDGYSEEELNAIKKKRQLA